MKISSGGKTELFERTPVPQALFRMAMPTIMSQMITLIYNMADTWFIGRTNNPAMVAASSLVLTVYLLAMASSNIFGVGGGTLAARLLGAKREDEARRVASLSLVMAGGAALLFSLLCGAFMEPLLRLLGARGATLEYAKQYLLFVVIIGALPTVLSMTMASLLRNVGFSREASSGLMFGGLLNIALDPLFMFVLLPDGYQVMGAGIATMLANVASLGFFVVTYRRVRHVSVLDLPRRVERVERASLLSIFGVGVPAAMGPFLFDLTNMVINRLSSGYGAEALAAVGIVLKAERLAVSTCVGICLAMVPLMAYNFSAKNYARMNAFFVTARRAGLVVSLLGVALYRTFAAQIIGVFIADPETVRYGTMILQARCFATPFMFLSFHMVHTMQALGKGHVTFILAAIRQLCLNIPILFVMDALFGMEGIVWTQVIADVLNVTVSYVIYHAVSKRAFPRAEAGAE